MTDPRPAARRSVFVRLVALLLTTGVSLTLLVTIFFGITLNRDFSLAFHRLVGDYATLAAATSPDLATAQRIHDRLGYDIRYQGPAGAWTTAEDLPSIEEARRMTIERAASRRRVLLWLRDDYDLVPSPDGGWYLFSWRLGRQMVNTVHLELLSLLALFVVAVLLTAYVVLHRLMRPLRLLGDGVARLSEGELGVVVPVRSRDEFGALTEAFNRMVRRVREMILARDQLLLDVSHELRSPLTRMKVALELLPEDGHRERMAGDVAEMEAMLAELLERERLRDGRGLRLARQDLVSIVRQVVDTFAERPPGVRLSTDAPALALDLDAEKICTVLGNLLDNAAKYSLPDSRPIEVSIAYDTAAVTVRVSDDGPGISAADQPDLFEPFFRVDRSRSRKTGGYGLGLSICKRIVEAHGGTIVVESPGGRGTTFLLRFSRPPTAS